MARLGAEERRGRERSKTASEKALVSKREGDLLNDEREKEKKGA